MAYLMQSCFSSAVYVSLSVTLYKAVEGKLNVGYIIVTVYIAVLCHHFPLCVVCCHCCVIHNCILYCSFFHFICEYLFGTPLKNEMILLKEFILIYRTFSTTTGWISMKFCTDLKGSQRMTFKCSTDFTSSASRSLMLHSAMKCSGLVCTPCQAFRR